MTLLATTFAVGIGGCGGGGDGSIPPESSENLLSLLTAVESQFSSGNCTLAEDAASDLTAAIAELPDDVDPEVERALKSGAENLTQLTEDPDNCAEQGATGADGDTSATEETDTEPTTVPTETTTPTVEETTTEEPEPPPEDDTPTEQQDLDPGNGQGPQGPQGGGPGDGTAGGGPDTGGVTPPGGKR